MAFLGGIVIDRPFVHGAIENLMAARSVACAGLPQSWGKKAWDPRSGHVVSKQVICTLAG